MRTIIENANEKWPLTTAESMTEALVKVLRAFNNRKSISFSITIGQNTANVIVTDHKSKVIAVYYLREET